MVADLAVVPISLVGAYYKGQSPDATVQIDKTALSSAWDWCKYKCKCGPCYGGAGTKTYVLTSLIFLYHSSIVIILCFCRHLLLLHYCGPFHDGFHQVF